MGETVPTARGSGYCCGECRVNSLTGSQGWGPPPPWDGDWVGKQVPRPVAGTAGSCQLEWGGGGRTLWEQGRLPKRGKWQDWQGRVRWLLSGPAGACCGAIATCVSSLQTLGLPSWRGPGGATLLSCTDSAGPHLLCAWPGKLTISRFLASSLAGLVLWPLTANSWRRCYGEPLHSHR